MDGWMVRWTEELEYFLWTMQWASCSSTSSTTSSSPKRVFAKRQAANKLNETRSRSNHQIGLYRRVSSLEVSPWKRKLVPHSLVDSLNIYIAKRRQRSFGPFLGILCWYGNSVVSCSTPGIPRAGSQPASHSTHGAVWHRHHLTLRTASRQFHLVGSLALQ